MHSAFFDHSTHEKKRALKDHGKRMNFFISNGVRIALFATALAGGAAHANMTVYPMSMTIGASGEGASTLQVISRSDDIQFVQATIKRITRPGTPQEKEELVSNWEGTGLVVSPPKFALPAGATRAVRVVGLTAPQAEEVYRVYLERVPLPSETELTIKDTTGNVSVNLIWGVLVHMVPSQPKVVLERAGTGALRNSGNVRAALMEFGRCTGIDDASCQWTKLNRNIYPGSDLDLPGATASALLRVKYQVEGTPEIQVKDLGPSR